MAGMFSLSKLLVLAAIIGAVWFGFKYLSRMQYQRELRAHTRDRVSRREKESQTGSSSARDMRLCPSCKAYVPAKGAMSCGRPDCPY